MKPLDFLKNCAMLNDIRCGNRMSKTGVASVNGGNSLNISFADSLYIEPAGRTLCDVALDTVSTPAGSFFVPGVETGEKSCPENPTQRR
jgi:hypothetical protein